MSAYEERELVIAKLEDNLRTARLRDAEHRARYDAMNDAIHVAVKIYVDSLTAQWTALAAGCLVSQDADSLDALDQLSSLTHAACKRAATQYELTGDGAWSEQYDLMTEAEGITDAALQRRKDRL